MRHYCTYFDEGYLSRGLVLYESLRQHGGPFRLWVLALSEHCADSLRALALPDLEIRTLPELEAADPQLAAVRANRSRVEYYFTCSPCWPRWVLQLAPDADLVTYLDADLAFFASPEAMFAELGEGHVAIVPHRFSARVPARFQRGGTYNVAWLSFRRSTAGLACLDWWRERCLEWCHDRYEADRYADQKYLDGFAARFPGVVAIAHPGANLAPWNVDRHRIEATTAGVRVDGQSLLFFHFQGLRAVGARHDVNFGAYRARLTPALRDAVYRPYICALGEAEVRLRRLVPPQAAHSQRRAGTTALRRWAGRAVGTLLAALRGQLLKS